MLLNTLLGLDYDNQVFVETFLISTSKQIAGVAPLETPRVEEVYLERSMMVVSDSYRETNNELD